MFISLFLFLLPVLTKAANDWSTPCAGSCAYETGDGQNTAWGSILIDGASEAISDISTAAGWSIMDCNSTSQDTQEIRLVCHDPDAGCDHLFQGGAVDTIVRLSAECADAPFARVVNVTTSTNQTLTPDVAERVAKRRRRSSPPEVMTVVIDYNFHLLPPSRGTISLTALATTNPLQRPLASSQNLRRALGYGESGSLNARNGNSAGEVVAREIRKRDLFADFIGGNRIPPGTTTDAASSVPNTTDRLMFTEAWTKEWNKQYNVFNIQDSFPVLDVDLSCAQNGDIPAFHAKAKIDADVNIQSTITVGFIVSGTILPPAITKAAFTSALDGSATVAFNVSAVAQGSFDTGLVPFYSSGMAGMSIPGILNIGPTFSINGQGTGNISVCTDAIVTANYQFPGLSMVFPQDQGPSSGQASQGNDQSPLHLSIGGSTSLTGSVSAHMIPRVDLGVSVLSGMASASVFLELDGYGTLDMSLTLDEATTTTALPADRSVTQQAAVVSLTSTDSTTLTTSDVTSSPSTEAPTSTPAPTLDASNPSTTASLPAAADDLALPPAAVHELSQDASPTPGPNVRPHHRQQQQQQQKREVNLYGTRDASDLYSGCVGVKMGVKIVAGAQGKLMSFWHDSTSFDLFSHEWQLLDKCFKGATKRSLPYRHGPIIPSSRPPSVHRRDLISRLMCPLIENALADAITASNEIV